MEIELTILKADIQQLQKECKNLRRENEAIVKILVEKVKPVVDTIEFHAQLKDQETEEAIYG